MRRRSITSKNAFFNAYWLEFISETQAASFLSLSRRTLQQYRMRGGGPKYFRLSPRCLRYQRQELKEWAERNAANKTAEYEGQEKPKKRKHRTRLEGPGEPAK